jgi:hypothetical protein
VVVSASGFDKRNSFACRGPAAVGYPFDFVFIRCNAANQPACYEQRADYASAPAVWPFLYKCAMVRW